MIEALQFEFMRNAVFAAVLAGIACGIIGSYVVVKGLVFISGGIAHASFGGIGLGYFLRIDPIIGVIPFSLVSALGIGLVSKRSKLSEDTTIGIFWAIGMAIGVIFIGLTPGYAPNLFSYLFGNILTVPSSDILLMLFLDALIIAIVTLFYKELLAFSFDEEFAKIAGVRVDLLYFALLGLVALTVVILMRVVGIILVIALLTIPAATAMQYTHSLKKMMFISTVLAIVFTLGGLWLSYIFNLASGATIILFSAIAFLLSSSYQTIFSS